MAQRGRQGGSRPGNEDNGDQRDRERERHRDHEREREREEPYDDPEEHHRIEKHRFAGGLPATPERYALAREQWYRLPGAVVRPSMDPGLGAPYPGKPQPSGQAHPAAKEPER